MRIINVPGRGIGQRTLDELSQWTKSLDIPLYTGLEKVTQEKSSTPFTPRAIHVLSNFFLLIKELIEETKELEEQLKLKEEEIEAIKMEKAQAGAEDIKEAE